LHVTYTAQISELVLHQELELGPEHTIMPGSLGRYGQVSIQSGWGDQILRSLGLPSILLADLSDLVAEISLLEISGVRWENI
jgi:hypothetical protein